MSTSDTLDKVYDTICLMSTEAGERYNERLVYRARCTPPPYGAVVVAHLAKRMGLSRSVLHKLLDELEKAKRVSVHQYVGAHQTVTAVAPADTIIQQNNDRRKAEVRELSKKVEGMVPREGADTGAHVVMELRACYSETSDSSQYSSTMVHVSLYTHIEQGRLEEFIEAIKKFHLDALWRIE